MWPRLTRRTITTATTISDALRHAKRPGGGPLSVALPSGPLSELVCRNLMCEDVGGACVCRLARCTGQLEGAAVEELRLVDHGLSEMPVEVLAPLAGTLRVLDLSRNRLRAVPAAVAGLDRLTELRLDGNAIDCWPAGLAPSDLPPGLEVLTAAGNGLRGAPPDAELRAALPALRELAVR